MASRQAKEERAEAAARQAAADLSDVNKGREHEEGQRPGVIGSVLKRVTDTYEHAKEVVVGKGHEAGETVGEYKDYTTDRAKETTDAARGRMRETKDYTAGKAEETKDSAKGKAEAAKEKAGEYKDYAVDKAMKTKASAVDYTKEKAEQAKNKAGEYKDYTADKAREAKDYTKDKTGEYKDYTAEEAENKAGEYKDYATEKTKEAGESAKGKAVEGKDYTTEKAQEGTATRLGELKDSARDAARRAMGFFSGKKEEAKDKATETADVAKEKLNVDEEEEEEEEEEAKRRIEQLHLESKGLDDEARRKDLEARDVEGPRGTAAKGNIFDAFGLGSVKESIKGKLTQPGDVVEETRAAREHGGTGRSGEEERRAGHVASTLKASDQVTGQTFNDVGRMDK